MIDSIPKEIIVALIEAVPGVLAGLALFVLILVFRQPIAERIIPNLSGLKILGVVEVTLLKQSLVEEATLKKVSVSEGDKSSVLKRAQRLSPLLRGARLLWVNDHHRRDHPLRKVLSSFDVAIDRANNTNEALKLLHRHDYHAVISDIHRSHCDPSGLEMLKRMWSEEVHRPTIFYVQELKPGIPEHAFNITNRPDDLLHYIMDVLDRGERWGGKGQENIFANEAR